MNINIIINFCGVSEGFCRTSMARPPPRGGFDYKRGSEGNGAGGDNAVGGDGKICGTDVKKCGEMLK